MFRHLQVSRHLLDGGVISFISGDFTLSNDKQFNTWRSGTISGSTPGTRVRLSRLFQFVAVRTVLEFDGSST